MVDIQLTPEAKIISERYGARAISNVIGTTPMQAMVAWAGLFDACQKMAHVALTRYDRYRESCVEGRVEALPYAEALEVLFPAPVTPVVYLACSLCSVIKDERRSLRQQEEHEWTWAQLSPEDSPLLEEFQAEERTEKLPEQALCANESEREFWVVSGAVGQAITALSEDYRVALHQRLERGQRREQGEKLPPATPQERQKLTRARAALRREVTRILGKMACTDNSFFAELCRDWQRPAIGNTASGMNTRKTRQKVTLANLPNAESWAEVQQERLYQKLLAESWVRRAKRFPEGDVEEAVVQELNRETPSVPPNTEFRTAMRVMDRYTHQAPTPHKAEASGLWDKGRELRRAGKLEEAVPMFLACHAAEPSFEEARIAAGVTLFRLGRLADARKIYLDILQKDRSGVYQAYAASNLSEIYLTWFKTGHGEKERQIEQALTYARMGMERPAPARAGNLLLTLVADRRFVEAETFLAAIFTANHPDCTPESLLKTLFPIREAALIRFWNWLETREEKK